MSPSTNCRLSSPARHGLSNATAGGGRRSIDCGFLDLPQACARAKRFATRPFKFTLTGPHMLAKTLVDNHYKNLPDLGDGHRGCARRTGPPHRRRRRSDRRSQPARQPGRMAVGGRRDEPVLDGRQDDPGSPPLLRQLWRSVGSERRLGAPAIVSERTSCRSCRARNGPPPARRSRGIARTAARSRHRSRRRRH